MKKQILCFLFLAFASTALAVGTSYWTHTSEADFKAGTFDNVVATNLGDLKLSRAMRTHISNDPRVSAVYALAETSDGTVYAATGPQGVLLKLKGDAVDTAASLGESLNLFSLAQDGQGRLLIGTGGATGAIYRMSKPGEKPEKIFSDEGAQYVWAMAVTPDGNVYAATGPNGKLFEIRADGSHKVLFENDENNLLSLASDGKDLLYVGTDPNGRVYRINRRTGESFVVYDATESEVSALVLDARGNLYAGTAQSTGEASDAVDAAVTDERGRPEREDGATLPLPGDPPKAPEPPKLPLPGPGDPPAIPRSSPGSEPSEPKRMMIDASAMQPADEPDPGPGPGPGPGQPKPPIADAAQQARMMPQSPVGARLAGAPAASGNAVYRIDADGFVTEIFRQNVLVLSLNEQDGVLLIGTGGEGMVYQVNAAAEETSVVTKVDPKAVMCLLRAKDGRVIMGMANDGQVASMSSGYAKSGTFISPVLDATQISRFGRVRLRGTLSENSRLTVSTRSGNLAEPAESGWSKWSDERPAAQFVAIDAPTARFFQYRLTFHSNDGTQTPVVDQVSAAYQVPNLPPAVKSITLTGAGDNPTQVGGANPSVTISWDAADPNEDSLQYALYYRTLGQKAGPWILLKDKLTEPTHEWNTRGVGDGRYAVKVVASDALANANGEGRGASRVSDPIEVDNTPAAIGDIKTDTPDAGAVKIAARVADRTATVRLLEYALDSSTDWQAVLPADKIADSPEETYAFTVGGLSAGPHQVGLRATDAHGNQSFETVTVTIK